MVVVNSSEMPERTGRSLSYLGCFAADFPDISMLMFMSILNGPTNSFGNVIPATKLS